MAYNELSETRYSMIDGVLHRDEAQWEKFYVKYRRLVVYLGRCLRLADQDIEELTSRVMVKFSRQEEKFQYNPDKQFRSYFARMVHSAAMDMFRERKRHNAVLAEWPTDEEGRPMDFAGCEDIESAMREHEANEIYAAAKDQLQREVRDSVKYQCWQLRYEEQWPVKKIVKYLDVPQSTVYWNSDEVARLLKQIYGRLTGAEPPADAKKKSEPAVSVSQHLSRAEILQYIFHECGFLLRRRIEGHLKKCPECSALVAEARQMDELQQKVVEGARRHVSAEMAVEESLSRFQGLTPTSSTGAAPGD